MPALDWPTSPRCNIRHHNSTQTALSSRVEIPSYIPLRSSLAAADMYGFQPGSIYTRGDRLQEEIVTEGKVQLGVNGGINFPEYDYPIVSRSHPCRHLEREPEYQQRRRPELRPRIFGTRMTSVMLT